ncbi:translocation/assembly module TamB domain-containing protein [Phenylobacterium sp. VNQ135]|uniref:translocation/assembly module TamB domain-containing protein n=1 Tax=Phenylobacterium sp. VNQ135 TaxID=3400922 RepID=UPI003C08FF0B
MSEAGDTSPPVVVRRSAIPKAIAAVGLAILAVLAIVFATGRWGVLTPQARLLIEARTDGLKLGRIGRLKLEGLTGDIWRDVRVRRLTIRDEKGVWLEAKDVHVQWRYLELLRRRFDADVIEAQSVRLVRRPTLGPKGKDRGLPVSFHIDALRARVIFEEGFSYRQGVYDLAANLDIERAGGRSGKVAATSVLHPGDRLNVDFAFGPVTPLRLTADAIEAQGGAMAGALGLPVDQPFELTVRAAGKASEGQFNAVARSGSVTPVIARGAWRPDGGSAGGRILLNASSLTSPYMARFGPELRFGLAGRRVDREFHALEGRIYADNLAVVLSGRGNLGERRLGPQGVRVDASTRDLHRLAGGPQAGPARVAGALTGTLQAWRFAGDGQLSDVALGAYGLARISGPLQVARDKGALSVKATLQGAGGRGQGFLAAMLGGTPVASLDGARLADGRLLLRDLDVAGQGLKVEASGGRSILGALTFKGRADISNLAAARPGAGGGAALTFQASQGGIARPWTVSVDARGRRLATGMDELDRLLGPEPRLQAQANWDRGALAVAKASLDGAALDATVAGALRRDRTLAFKADWSAQGPFRAGPVEISGRAKGTGAVTGALAEPRLDLIADVDAIDVPRLPLKNAKVTLSFLRRADGSNGLVAIAADSAYGPARAKSAFRFPEGGVDLTELAVDAGGLKATGALSLRRRSPSAADLDLLVTQGAFLDAGRVTGDVRIVDAGGPRAMLDLRAENARPAGTALAIRSARVTADGPLNRLPYTVLAEGGSRRGAWRLDGRGTLSEANAGYALGFDGMGRLGRRDVRTVETAVFRFGGGERAARLRLASSDGGRIDFDGALRGEAADVQARVAGVTLEMFDPDLAGRIDATLNLAGRGRALSGGFEARLADARGRGAPEVQGMDGVVTGRLAGDSLRLQAQTRNEQGLRADADVMLPAEASAAPFRVAIARQRPMRGRFSAEGEVRPLWDLLFGGERALAGFVRTQGTLGGTLADPSAVGQISVERGRFDDGGTGLSLRDVSLNADFTRNGVDVTQASGVDGHGGRVSGAGRISLARNGVSSFRLDLQGFRLIDNEIATAAATGQATIARAADGKVRLSGDLAIDRADVAADLPTPSGVVALDVKEINRPQTLDTGLPPPRTRGQGWLLDVNLRAPRRVFLRGRGLDVELSLDAHVGGTTTRPDLSGVARVVRGDYEFAGKRFEFDDASVVYLATRPQNIRLQLDAVRDDPTLRVTVRIRGTAAEPEVTLASSPTLPNDEVLSQVLFGRSASQLSPVEAAQLASALSSLTGGGGLDVIGNLRTFAGLDRLAFGGGDEAGVTVSGGKYLTDDVYLELTGGGREGGAAQVEWRIRRNLAIISRITGQGDNRLAVRWRRDY